MSSGAIEASHPATDLRATRRGVLALFLLNGVGIASWAAHIPYVKEKFALSEGALGVALLAVAAGSVSALLFGGQLVARLGSRAVTIGGAFGVCAALPLLLLMPVFPLLFPVLMLFGACIGAMEVALNVQAIGVEERYGRPIMSSFHALFSVGGLLGAAVAGLSLSRGVDEIAHMIVIGLGLAVLTVVAVPRLLPSDAEQTDDAPALALPTGPLLGLGILAFFCLVAEGAMADWSAVYLRESLHTDASFAAAGYAAFSVAMAAGRFGGDALRARLHAVPLVRLSGAVAAGGLGIALVIGQPVATLVGFACVGLGLSNVVPVLFTAAGRTPGVAMSTGIAAVASFGYFGFLLGPPVIGFVAQLTTLTWGLGVLVALLTLIALLASGAARADE